MASIHPQSSSMAEPGRLAAVPEGSSAPPPRSLYSDWIRTVPVSGAQRRSTMRPTIFGHSGSSYSTSASSSCPSNNSGHSSGSASAFALERLGNQELWRIARQMISDGYTQRMVQAFDGTSPAPALLANWFSVLAVDWVLQIHDEHGLRRLLQDKPATTRDLADKWIRALTVIVTSITELHFDIQTPAGALFGKASITGLLDVVDVIITLLQAEKLEVMLDMFTVVCRVSGMLPPVNISPDGQSVFNEAGGLLERERNRLIEIISNTVEEVRTLIEEDDSWAIEIPRGGAEVHNNTRFITDCIVSMMNAQTSTRISAPSHYSENLGGLIDGTIDYLKALLFTKSESCSDQSLRYLFLINNSYFVARGVFESSGSFIPELWYLTFPPECKKYMDSYLDVSWGPMLSCLPKLRSPGLIHRLINTPSLAKFESAFHKTYQAQKFWKVPDPKLRNDLRRAITERVISGYRDYLEGHPEIEKHVGRESRSPEVLQEMLGQLFEG